MMHEEVPERPHAVPPVAERLASFEAATTPQEQWHALDAAIDHDPAESYAFTSAMLDIAANPNSSPALLVRMRALELAASELKYGHATANQAEFEKLREGLQTLLPEYFEMDTLRAAPQNNKRYWPDEEGDLTRFGQYALRFAHEDGIPRELVSDEWTEDRDTHILWRVQDPGIGLVPGLLLERMVGQEADGRRYAINTLSHSVKRDMTSRLLTSIPRIIRGEEDGSGLGEIAEYAHLGRFNQVAMGEAMHGPLEALYKIGSEESLEYARVINRLYDAAGTLSEVFPAELGGNVSRAARVLIGKSLYAVAAHLQSGDITDGTIALKNGFELPVHFEKGEPLLLLRGLEEAFAELHAAVKGPDAHSVLSVDGQGFRMYRLFKDAQTTNVTHYIRPMGDLAFNREYEHGRNYEGVEASIGFNIEIRSPKGLPGLKKNARGKQVISIRLDREARPDPRAQDGKISLDIGSVLGNESSFGTKIGRLIAWGDTVMRINHPERATLNHMDYILGSTYGAADRFMRLGMSQDERMQAMARGRRALKRRVGRSGLTLAA